MATPGLNKGVMIVGAALLVSAPANASDGSMIAISGRVPTVCQVSVAAPALPPLQTGQNDLGTLTELCNNVDGYTITLNHPAGLTDAWVEVDGGRIPLSPTATHTVIVDTSAPAYRARPLRLVLDHAPVGPLALSLDAQPKGLLF